MTCTKKHTQTVEDIVESRFGLHGGHSGIDVLLTIEYISGFELFNHTPYHCYETWCQGWRVTYGYRRIERECLLCALEELL